VLVIEKLKTPELRETLEDLLKICERTGEPHFTVGYHSEKSDLKHRKGTIP
jgi:hypothetical protein